MTLNNDFVDELKMRINIVDVIGRDVDLKKAGSGYKGLCPFHNEKTPSFSVNEKDQYFHCFGCHAKGDVITYVMKKQGLTFMEAVEKLADEYGIKMPERTGRREDFSRFYNINKMAARYFFHELTARPNMGLKYLRDRQVKDSTIAKFGLGYSSSSYEGLYEHLKSQGVSDEDMLRLGLVKQGKRGPYDKYRSRVMFPIFDTTGRVIGFGGRKINNDDRGPKYLNSSESEIFLKKNNLFGLNITKSDISRADQVLIVEGYMDMISLWQNGVTNVVASLGTALTENQVRLVTRFTKNVILSYDSDEAGIRAALRGIEVFDGSGANVRILQVTGGKDPDEYVKKYGGKAFQKLVQDALPAAEFRFKAMVRGRDLTDERQLLSYIRDIIPFMRKMDPLEQEIYIKKLHRDYGIGEMALQSQLRLPEDAGSPKYDRRREHINVIQKEPDDRKLRLELSLASLMMSNRRYINRAREDGITFETALGSRVVAETEKLAETWGDGRVITLDDICSRLDPDEESRVRKLIRPVGPEEEEYYLQCRAEYQLDKLDEKRAEYQHRIVDLEMGGSDEDKEEIEALARAVVEIDGEKNRIRGSLNA
ncbi:DNA primase [Mobilibacterium timonense]|uniref:DNA primase n=1 Tax=Mobilibacterium timonense TaxID=1871012 RepID=UPI0009867AED|nr:DNA primase [Mobilibacterium timonense]